MAIKRFTIDGYGQLELNNATFRRDGRIEAQCALDSTDFENVPAENGMLLAVDKVNRTVKFATDGSLPIALVYSSEHTADERHSGLKDFKLNIGDVYPRLGYPTLNDIFTTNCICYDETDFANDDALITACEKTTLNSTPIYGGISANGAIKVSKTKPEAGVVLLVVQKTTMPDGQFGLKFQTLKA